MTQDSSNDTVIERVFCAPRDLVWQAWTDSAHVAKWWGLGGLKTLSTNSTCAWAAPGATS